MAELPEFLAVIGGFGGEDAVFPFWRFREVIVNPFLSECGPDQQQKYHREQDFTKRHVVLLKAANLQAMNHQLNDQRLNISVWGAGIIIGGGD